MGQILKIGHGNFVFTMEEKLEIIILLGAKGSGKTYLGKQIETHFKIYFFHTEKYWMEYMSSHPNYTIPEAMQYVHIIMEEKLKEERKIIVETLGYQEIFDDLLRICSRNAKIIRIKSSWPSCLQRIRNRDQIHQIEVSEHHLVLYHQMTDNFICKCDLELTNEIEEQFTWEGICTKIELIIKNKG